MRIYLAGENGKLKILSALGGGTEAIKRYINADVSSRNRSVDISRLYDCRGGWHP